jgi:glycerol-3-phosphate dehydrogenase
MPGAWFVAGGKLTTHRRMAEDAVDRVVAHLGLDLRCPTRSRGILSGSLERGEESLRRLGLDPATVAALAELQGARLERLAADLGGGGPIDDEACLRAQVRLAVEEEWALGLDDLLLRRLGPGPLDLRACHAQAGRAAALLAEALGWTAAERDHHLQEFRSGVESDLVAAGLAPAGAEGPPT